MAWEWINLYEAKNEREEERARGREAERERDRMFTANNKYYGWENVEREMYLNRRFVASIHYKYIVIPNEYVYMHFETFIICIDVMMSCCLCRQYRLTTGFRHSANVDLQLDLLLILIHCLYSKTTGDTLINYTCTSIDDLRYLAIGHGVWIFHSIPNAIIQCPIWLDFVQMSLWKLIDSGSEINMGSTVKLSIAMRSLYQDPNKEWKLHECRIRLTIVIRHTVVNISSQQAAASNNEKTIKWKKIDEEKMLLINNQPLWHFFGAHTHSNTRNHLCIDPMHSCISPRA